MLAFFIMVKINVLGKCIGCGKCVSVCPTKVFELDNKSKAVAPQRCIKCGHCVGICPVDAIDHSAMYMKECSVIKGGCNISQKDIECFLRRRRSIRNFLGKEVPKKKLLELIDIACYAPTGHNAQNFEFVVVADKRKVMEVKKITIEFYRKLVKDLSNPVMRSIMKLVAGRKKVNGAMKFLGDFKWLVNSFDNGKDVIAYDAPALIVVHAPKGFDSGINCSYASYNIMLSAEAMGLGTCFMGFIQIPTERDKSLAKYLQLPEGNKVHAILAVGYPKYKYRRLVSREKAKVRYL